MAATMYRSRILLASTNSEPVSVRCKMQGLDLARARFFGVNLTLNPTAGHPDIAVLPSPPLLGGVCIWGPDQLPRGFLFATEQTSALYSRLRSACFRTCAKLQSCKRVAIPM